MPIVYVLTNECMEGIVKIGRTSTSVEQRIRELDTTGVPLPFQCFHAGEVADANAVEVAIHRIFSDKRIRNNREFFRVDPTQVREAIKLAQIKDVTPREDVLVDASDAEALKNAANIADRRARLRFSELDIPVGSTLTFSRDQSVTCCVVANGRVDFEGQIMSPSAAALLAVRRLGYKWSAVSGSDFWEYEGETLVARRLRREEEQE